METEPIAVVAGWIWWSNPLAFVREIARLVDYDFDELDEVALDVPALLRGRQVSYPLYGRMATALAMLEHEPGESVVSIRVEIREDQARAVEALVSVMQEYELRPLGA